MEDRRGNQRPSAMTQPLSPGAQGLRWTTGGESHGPSLVAILEGLPAGLRVDLESIQAGMMRRWEVPGRGPRAKFEKDALSMVGGMKRGVTLGSPLVFLVGNGDSRIDELPNLAAPRPGHADLAGVLRHRNRDIRAVLERASARETAARTAVGEVGRSLLAHFGIQISSQVLEIGGVGADKGEDAWLEAVDQAREAGDTLGGVFSVKINGSPPGVGGYAQPTDRLDARLMAALASLPAIKGVEIGLGFSGSSTPGSDYHDGICIDSEGWAGLGRTSNRCGGIEGGLTTGGEIQLQAVMKPISTLRKGLPSVDLKEGTDSRATYERSDVCAVWTAAVVGEAVVALEMASALRARLGGVTLAEMVARFKDLGKDDQVADWPDDLADSGA